MPYQTHSTSQNAGSGAATSLGAGYNRSGKKRKKPAKLSLVRGRSSAASSTLEASLHEETFELDLLVPTTSGWRRPSLRISAYCEFGVVRDVAISFDR
jgi:hypothetical protein